MNIPVSYIILEMMVTLKENNKDTKISIDTLIIYIKRLINLLHFDREVLEELVVEFNLDEELDEFFEEYFEYFELDAEDNIILKNNVGISKLKKLLQANKNSFSIYDNEYFEDIHSIIHSNICFLDILGIKINYGVYNVLLELEKELECEYLKLSYDRLLGDKKEDKICKRIKILKILINTMYINTDTNFTESEYNNLFLYASENVRSMKGENEQINLSYSPSFDENLLLSSTMDRALFINDSISKFVLASRIEINLKKKNKHFTISDYTKLNFYLMYFKLLEKEIENIRNEELKDELVVGKYRMMYALDSIYDLMSFIKEEKVIKLVSDYEFISSIVYFFINEILNYRDSDYKNKEKKDIVTYYFNIIKKIYIETYYKLTGDERVIEAIKNNEFYGVNKISTKLLSDIVPIEAKTKKKKINYKNLKDM